MFRSDVTFRRLTQSETTRVCIQTTVVSDVCWISVPHLELNGDSCLMRNYFRILSCLELQFVAHLKLQLREYSRPDIKIHICLHHD